jgi:hypothetical protein
METLKEASQEYDASQWREWLIIDHDIPEASAALMDLIASIISPEHLEESYEEILNAGNKDMKAEIPPREGLKISAMISWAKKAGVITADEARALEYRVASKT